jgi:hypothetical protein
MSTLSLRLPESIHRSLKTLASVRVYMAILHLPLSFIQRLRHHFYAVLSSRHHDVAPW